MVPSFGNINLFTDIELSAILLLTTWVDDVKLPVDIVLNKPSPLR